MHIYQVKEFQSIITILTICGLFHIFPDKNRKPFVRYITFIYCLLRTILGIMMVILLILSMAVSADSFVQKFQTTFDTFVLTVNVIFIIFYLCTNEQYLTEFIREWQKSRLIKVNNIKSYKGTVMITIGILFSIPWICFVVYTTFINQTLSDYFTNLYLGYIIDFNDSLEWPVRILMFLVIGIFDQLSIVFIPIFYSIISFTVAAEFSEWNKCLGQDIPREQIVLEDNTIENYRLKYEGLCHIVRTANNFLSLYLGFNLLTNLASICFLSYNIIMNWDEYLVALIYAILWTIILLVLIGGSGLINSQVKFFELSFHFILKPKLEDKKDRLMI